jgi:hypothetical protein
LPTRIPAFAALLSLYLFGLPLDLYSFIGIIRVHFVISRQRWAPS